MRISGLVQFFVMTYFAVSMMILFLCTSKIGQKIPDGQLIAWFLLGLLLLRDYYFLSHRYFLHSASINALYISNAFIIIFLGNKKSRNFCTVLIKSLNSWQFTIVVVTMIVIGTIIYNMILDSDPLEIIMLTILFILFEGRWTKTTQKNSQL